MSFFVDLESAEISDDQWRAWALTAYFPTQSQLRPMADRLGFTGSRPKWKASWEWYTNHTDKLFLLFTEPKRTRALLATVKDYGLVERSTNTLTS